jgi:hypothetical protein
MGNGAWGMGHGAWVGDKRGKGERKKGERVRNKMRELFGITLYFLHLSPFPFTLSPSSKSPMPNYPLPIAQFPIPKLLNFYFDLRVRRSYCN